MTVKKDMLLKMLDNLGDNDEMELAALSPQVMALTAANMEYRRELDVVQAEVAAYRRKLETEQARRWQQNGDKLAAYNAASKPLTWWQYVILVGWLILHEVRNLLTGKRLARARR